MSVNLSISESSKAMSISIRIPYGSAALILVMKRIYSAKFGSPNKHFISQKTWNNSEQTTCEKNIHFTTVKCFLKFGYAKSTTQQFQTSEK